MVAMEHRFNIPPEEGMRGETQETGVGRESILEESCSVGSHLTVGCCHSVLENSFLRHVFVFPFDN